MTEIFSSVMPVGVNKDHVRGLDRTIFIPDAAHASDWCIVYEKSNRAKLSVIASD